MDTELNKSKEEKMKVRIVKEDFRIWSSSATAHVKLENKALSTRVRFALQSWPAVMPEMEKTRSVFISDIIQAWEFSISDVTVGKDC